MSSNDLETNHLSSPPMVEKHTDLQLAWSDLTYVAPKREQPILNNLNGSARSGELLAGEPILLFRFPFAVLLLTRPVCSLE